MRNFSERLKNINEYYFSKKLEEVRRLEEQGLKIINLGIGSPDLPPSEETVNELIKSAKNPKNHSYQPYKSIKQLRIAMCDWYEKTYGILINPEKEILPLLGSKEGIFYLTMAMLDKTDTVLIPDPGYPAYTSAASIAGANIMYYNLKEENNWYPDFQELEKYDLSKVKLMWVNYPNMPTGTKSNSEIFTKLIEFGEKNNIMICNDNPYSLILNDNPLSLLEADKEKKYSIELNSLSKSFNMAGWRVGMIIGNEKIIEAVLKIKSNVDSGMFKPLQDAAIIALNAERSWHKKNNEIYLKRRNAVFKMLDLLNLKYNKQQVGLFVWAKVPDNINNTENFLDEILYNKGIFITPGRIFGKNAERYVRVSLCADEKTIKEAINRIMEF